MTQAADSDKSDRSEHAKYESSVQQQLHDLMASIRTEKSLVDQLLDLREGKATILEKLNATDKIIAESHEVTLKLKSKEETYLLEIARLNDQVSTLSTQAAEAVLSVQRLQEMESLKVKMTDQISTMQRSLNNSEEALAHRDEEVTRLKQSLESSRAESAMATLAIAESKSEKSELESRASARYESMKDQLEAAAKGARKIVANEHSSTVQRLKLQKNLADNKVREMTDLMEKMKTDYTGEVGWESHLTSDHILNSIQQEASEQLRVQIANVEIRNSKYESQLASLQDKLREAVDNEKSREAEIENAAEDVLNHDHQRLEAEQRLASMISQTQEKDGLMLTKITSECLAYDEDIIPESDVDTALETLFFCLHFSKAQAFLKENQEIVPECKSRSPTPSQVIGDYSDAAVQTLIPTRDVESPDIATQTLDTSQPERFDALDAITQTLSSSPVRDIEALHIPIQGSTPPPIGDAELLDIAIQALHPVSVRESEDLDIAIQASQSTFAKQIEVLDSQDHSNTVRKSVQSPSKSLDENDLEVNKRPHVERLNSVRQESSPIKPKRKANRHSTSRTKTSLGISPRDELLIHESQIKETTFRRSVKRTTTSRGGDTDRSVTGTPSRFPRESSFPISTFSQFHRDVSQSLDRMSPMADMRGFFPPTPQQCSKDDSKDDSPHESVDLIGWSMKDIDAPKLHQSEREHNRKIYQSNMEQVEESYDSSNINRNSRVNKFAAMAEAQTGSSRATIIPKGILKDPKGTKRTNTTAGLAAGEAPKKMRVRPTESQGLGPIIADSQSPKKDANASKSNPRGRKSKRRATNGK